MGSQIDRGRLQGIGVPVEGVEIWREQSANFTEAEPAPGIPQPQQATNLGVSAFGKPTAGTSIKIQEPGIAALVAPSQSPIYQGATYLCRRNPTVAGDADWYGWDPATSMTTFRVIAADNSGSGDEIRAQDVATTADDYVVAVVDLLESGVYKTGVYIMDPETETWGALVELGTYDAATVRGPCIVALPSGRVQVYEVINEYIRMWYSDDNGASWYHGGDKINDQPVAGTITKMRAAYSGGQICLFAETTGDVYQYGSSDLGLTFQLVDSSVSHFRPDVCAIDGGFVVVAANDTTGPQEASFAHVISSAYFSWRDAPQVLISSFVSDSGGGGVTSGDWQAVTRCNAGVLWYLGHIGDVAYSAFSYNNGQSWFTPVDDIDSFYITGAGAKMTGYAMTWQRGRAIFSTQHTNPTAAWDYALWQVTFGGWTDYTTPSARISNAERLTLGWQRAFVPVDQPNAIGWLKVGTGTGLLNAGTGTFNLQTTGTNTLYILNPAPTAARDLAVRFRVDPAGLTPGDTVLGMGTGTMGLIFRMSSTIVEVHDTLGGLLGQFPIGTAIPTHVEVWAEIDHSNAFAVVWARECNASFPATTEARNYTEVYRGALTTGSAPATLYFGNGNASVTSIWHSLAYANRTTRFDISADGPHPPTAGSRDVDLRGRHMSGQPYALSGNYIEGVAGPAWRGESWDIAREPLYGLQNLLKPSPRIPWRSTGVDFGSTIALKWSSAGQDVAESGVLAVVLRDTNLPRVELERWTGAAWVSMGVFEPGLAGLPARPVDVTTEPAAASASTKYLQRNEYKNATLHHYTSGAAPSAYNATRIAHHTEGKWQDTNLRARIRTTSAMGGDTIDIRPTDFVMLVETDGIDVGAIRLRIGSTSNTAAPAEGYWQIGAVGLFWVYPLGDEYAWGRAVDTQAQVEVQNTRDGQTRVRVAAPARRVVTLGWDPVDQTTIESEDAAPDYVLVTQTGNGQAGAIGGTATMLEGLVRQLDGPALPLLYLPNLPSVETSALLYRRREFVVGRISEAASAQTVVGTEMVDEVVTPGQLIITEEI